VLHGHVAFVIVASVKSVAELIAPPPDGCKGVPARAWLPHIAAPAHPRYDGERMSPEPMDIAMQRATSCSSSLACPALKAIAVLPPR
jgi:hypothetical protein